MEATDDHTLPISRYRLRLERSDPQEIERETSRYRDATDAVPLIARILAEEPFEVLGALFLDLHNRPTGYAMPYRGTMRRAPFEPRGVIAPAILCNASGLILFHNHPGGNTMPSSNDLIVTHLVDDAARTMGMRVWDHLVFGEGEDYQSIRSLMGVFSAARQSP